VKLLISEPESQALDSFLAGWPLRVSSELLRVELTCVCHRQRIPPAGVEELLGGLRLLPLTAMVLSSACQAFSPPQRALDALHLASAAEVREQIGCFASYDGEQLAAAARLGLQIESPA